jgi:hypothetical protein
MNSMERKRIEAKVRALQFAKAEENIMPISSMKEYVLTSYKSRLNGNHRGKSERIGLRLIRSVVLAAACLLMAVCVYAALDPVLVSNANSFLRRAQIWVNSALKTDIVMEPPEKKGALLAAAPDNKEDTAALKEIHETLGLTVLQPTQFPAGMTLKDVKTSGADEVLSKVRYSYRNLNDTLEFNIMEIGDQMGASIFAENIEHKTPVGTFFVWGDDLGWNAVVVCGSSYINIRGTLSKDEFLRMLDGLREVN